VGRAAVPVLPDGTTGSLRQAQDLVVQSDIFLFLLKVNQANHSMGNNSD
jgi:hypothetical protein